MLTRVASEHELVSFDPTTAPACEVDPGDVVSIETSGAILRQLAAGHRSTRSTWSGPTPSPDRSSFEAPRPAMHCESRSSRRRSRSETICVGMGQSHPEARASAVQQALAVLTETHRMATADAYADLCARVALRPAGPSGSTVDGLEAALAAVPDPG